MNETMEGKIFLNNNRQERLLIQNEKFHRNQLKDSDQTGYLSKTKSDTCENQLSIPALLRFGQLLARPKIP